MAATKEDGSGEVLKQVVGPGRKFDITGDDPIANNNGKRPLATR
jgi:hypothetical protein